MQLVTGSLATVAAVSRTVGPAASVEVTAHGAILAQQAAAVGQPVSESPGKLCPAGQFIESEEECLQAVRDLGMPFTKVHHIFAEHGEWVHGCFLYENNMAIWNKAGEEETLYPEQIPICKLASCSSLASCRNGAPVPSGAEHSFCKGLMCDLQVDEATCCDTAKVAQAANAAVNADAEKEAAPAPAPAVYDFSKAKTTAPVVASEAACPQGQGVASAADCTKALEDLGFPSADVHEVATKQAQWPPGCFVYQAHSAMFNPRAEGASEPVLPETHLICAKAECSELTCSGGEAPKDQFCGGVECSEEDTHCCDSGIVAPADPLASIDGEVAIPAADLEEAKALKPFVKAGLVKTLGVPDTAVVVHDPVLQQQLVALAETRHLAMQWEAASQPSFAFPYEVQIPVAQSEKVTADLAALQSDPTPLTTAAADAAAAAGHTQVDFTVHTVAASKPKTTTTITTTTKAPVRSGAAGASALAVALAVVARTL